MGWFNKADKRYLVRNKSGQLVGNKETYKTRITFQNMTDYSTTVKLLTHNYLSYKERAADKSSAYRTRLMYDGFVATREQALIELANKIIAENERIYYITQVRKTVGVES